MESETSEIACNLIAHMPIHFSAFIVIGYFFGSIPFGLILCKFFGKGDIRNIGSGNIGATNVLRSGSKSLAAATLLLDATKPFLAFIFTVSLFYANILELDKPCALAGHSVHTPFGRSEIDKIWPLPDLIMPIVLGSVLGHCFPIWLKFKGGKGVATALGGLLIAAPLAGLSACFVWLLSAFLFKISSLAAMIALSITPFVTLLLYGKWAAILCSTIVLLVFWRHKENIQRLMKGEEPKIGAKK